MAKNNVSQKNNQFENFCEKCQCVTWSSKPHNWKTKSGKKVSKNGF